MPDIVTPKAVITQVSVGSKSIEGLMAEDGTYWVAVPQLAELQLVPPNRSAKQLQALLDIFPKTHQKLKTDFNRNITNAISLPDFERLLLELALSGNQAAIAIR